MPSLNYARVSRFLPVFLICCQACVLCYGAETADASNQNDAARRILADAGVRGGLVVHLGCGDGRLTAALRAGDAFLVQGLDADAGNADEAHSRIG